MRCISPRDSLETLFAAQIVVGHLLGMRKLAESYSDDQKLGLNLLRFSNEAMQQLEKKRSGVTQNIVVNYSHNGQANALVQTVLTKEAPGGFPAPGCRVGLQLVRRYIGGVVVADHPDRFRLR